jgi:hypothetical protein
MLAKDLHLLVTNARWPSLVGVRAILRRLVRRGGPWRVRGQMVR